MPDDRLKKRQRQYRQKMAALNNVAQNDPFRAEKLAAAESLRALTEKIDSLSPYDPAGNDKPGAVAAPLTMEELNSLDDLYQKAIKDIDALSQAQIARFEQLFGGREKNEENMTREQRILQQFIHQNDLLAKTLSKDLTAVRKDIKSDIKLNMHDIYEESRTNSSYTVVSADLGNSQAGNQNERIPVKIRNANGDEIEGYFTPDSRLEEEPTSEEVIERAKAKYGKLADFAKFSDIQSIGDQIFAEDRDILSTLINHPENMHVLGWLEIVEGLESSVSEDVSSILNTPERVHIFVDLLHIYLAHENKVGISEEAELDQTGRINRRNAAMSAVADYLGCPDIIAKSENVKLNINGRTVKGTFMKKADGLDVHKITETDLFEKVDPMTLESLELKKQIADLQILDYICGNPDRHGGNMLYDLIKNPDGTVSLRTVQGIDNDTAFVGFDYEAEKHMKSIPIENLKVITKSMADKVLGMNEDSLKQMLYGYEISAKEMEMMAKRLKTLQTRILSDQMEYSKGYKKGSLIEGKIKVVDDDELEVMSFSEDLATRNGSKRYNVFEGVRSNVVSADANIKDKSKKLLEQYRNAVVDVTFGSLCEADETYKMLDDNRVWHQGRDKPYNKMADAILEIRNVTAGHLGNMDIDDKEHNEVILRLKEMVDDALTKTDVYLDYKMNKTSGEEWMALDPNIKNDPNRKKSKEEKRFLSAKKAYTFLNKMKQKLNKLDKQLEKRNSFNRRNAKLLAEQNKDKTADKKKEYDDKIFEAKYQNHLSRLEYELTGTLINYTNIDKKKEPAKKFNAALDYDIRLGYAILTLKKEDQRVFAQKFAEMAKKQPEDPDILAKRGVASVLVNLKMVLEDKRKKGTLKNNDSEVLKNLRIVDVKKPSEAVNKLMANKSFERYYKMIKREYDDRAYQSTSNIHIPTKGEASDMAGTLAEFIKSDAVKTKHEVMKKGNEQRLGRKS